MTILGRFYQKNLKNNVILFWTFGTSKLERSATIGDVRRRSETFDDGRPSEESFGERSGSFGNVRGRSELFGEPSKKF